MSRWLSLVAACRDAHTLLADAPTESAGLLSSHILDTAASSPSIVLLVCSVVDGWERTSESLRCHVEPCNITMFDGSSVGILKARGIEHRRSLRKTDLGLYAQQILLDAINTAEDFASICRGHVLLVEKCLGHSLDNSELRSHP
jgi:hypothetical protein